MHVVSVLADIAEHPFIYLACVCLAGLIAVYVNYVFLGKYTCGIIYVQISFAFNAAVVLFGWHNGDVSTFRVLHFFSYEMITVIGVYWVYTRILRSRARLFESLQSVNVEMVSTLIILYNLAISLIEIKYVLGSGGASRISYMEAPWFSYIRPVIFIFDPLSFLIPIYLLDRGKRLLPMLILGTSVATNILAGSKASFLYGVIIMLLFYEDLKGARLAISKPLKALLIMVLSASALFALVRLNEGMTDMAARLALTGESTIMLYYSDQPQAAAEGVSALAKIHRGVAKALGDSSAKDPDTLFGFALSRLEYGANTSTGPNSAIASYMLCNYSGWGNLIGLACIVGYLVVISLFYDLFILRRNRETSRILFVPFVVTSLYNFPQDYNHGMSDITALCIYVLIAAWASAAVSAGQDERRRSYDAT